MSISYIDSGTLSQLLIQRDELAVLDLRTAQQFGKWGAPLNASNLPYAQLEREIGRYVPRKGTTVVLVDDGGGKAQLASERLQALGYEHVHVLAGGFPAWVESGLEPGFSVTGNDYSEQIRQQYNTPSISARQLQTLYQDGRDVIVLDTRAPDEYINEHVPGAVSVPGAELVQRFADLVPAVETLVVVSCALLARAILGAQTLINAGVPNQVVYLYNGTKGWSDAGLTLERGPTRAYGPASEVADEFAARKARHLLRPAIGNASVAQIDGWRQDESRTTYLLDVRSAAEYEAGHVDGALSAPGGQLILGTFRFFGVRGARLVLIDDNGVRAITTAHWLRQRGWEVFVFSTAQADAWQSARAA